MMISNLQANHSHAEYSTTVLPVQDNAWMTQQCAGEGGGGEPGADTVS